MRDTDQEQELELTPEAVQRATKREDVVGQCPQCRQKRALIRRSSTEGSAVVACRSCTYTYEEEPETLPAAQGAPAEAGHAEVTTPYGVVCMLCAVPWPCLEAATP